MERILYKIIASFACIGLFAIIYKQTVSYEPIDNNNINLLQFSQIEECEDVAKVSTSKGDFFIRFFPQEAHDTVEKFKYIIYQGEYNSTILNYDNSKDIINTENLNTGTKSKIVSKINLIKPQFSINLCHFPGAVSVLLNDKGEMTGNFFIVGDNDMSLKSITDMAKSNYPQNIINKFEEVGGYPQLWLKYPVFAQVYKGIEVVNQILNDKESVTIYSINLDKYSNFD